MAALPSPSISSEKDDLSIPVEPAFTYSEQEEKRVFWKLNFTVLPLLFFGFYVFQLERGNISNALTDGLLHVGIILLEIPSNYVLQWIGPRYWISFQVLAFGLVATFQAFQHDRASFLTTRILLGITECGYIPGSLYTLSTFYKRTELASVTAVFFIGSYLATATSGLLAYGIFPMGTRYPQLSGWQYLMLIEGSMACFVALVIIILLPGSPTRPRPLFLPFRYFSDREEQIIVHRVVLDDAAKAAAQRRLTFREIAVTVVDWRVWVHLIMCIAYISPGAAVGTYGPSIIRSFNFDTLSANALSSVSGWVLLIVTFAVGYASDKIQRRGLVVSIGLLVTLAFWIAFQQVTASNTSDRWLKFAMQTLVSGFGATFHPLNITWMSLNCRTPQATLMSVIMASNAGGLVGSQLFRADDAPNYYRGFKVGVAMRAFATALAIAQMGQYMLSNRRLAKKRQIEEGEGDEGKAVKEFRYTL